MKLRITNYELRITNYELRITNYELRITNYELRITNYGKIENSKGRKMLYVKKFKIMKSTIPNSTFLIIYWLSD